MDVFNNKPWKLVNKILTAHLLAINKEERFPSKIQKKKNCNNLSLRNNILSLYEKILSKGTETGNRSNTSMKFSWCDALPCKLMTHFENVKSKSIN